ncbi:MAG: helix-turn-helix domain-containing protein [Peptostreptococcales bacterium]
MEYEEKIKWILTTFFRITQIEALYFDSQMNATSCQFQAHTYDDFCRLSMGEIEAFLKNIVTGESNESTDSYTYYLRHNFICNISVLNNDGKCGGAIITQPVVLNTLKKDELKLKYATLPSEERDACIAAMLRAPIVSQDRIIPIGGTLDSLIKHIFGTANFKPVMCGGEVDPLSYQLMQPDKIFSQQHKPSQPYRFGGYSTYFKIKNAISTGDTEALLNVFDLIGNDNIPMDQHASKDIIRSIKNRFIEGCAMGSFFAIEAQAPYDKTRDFIKQIIREIESTDNINDMYNLVRSALKTLTRYVAMARINGYSKHIRLAMEHIEKHFAEEITLESLAQVTGTSKYYLSSLIKKETGLSFTDIINRVRIEKSKKMLTESKISLATLSLSVGFANSNYFSKVFKQHTGMTPTKFSNSILKSADEDAKSKDILRALLNQLSHAMEIFSGIFDLVRIVDPILNKAWVVHPSGKILESTCYDFWSRKQSCDKCISHMALNRNKSFMKLDQEDVNLFFVLATPITIGGTKFVINLLKKTEDNFLNCTKVTGFDDLTAEHKPNH